MRGVMMWCVVGALFASMGCTDTLTVAPPDAGAVAPHAIEGRWVDLGAMDATADADVDVDAELDAELDD